MLQGSEVLIILLVALVVLGPQRLPEIARKLGNWSAELRRAARDFRVGLESEVADLRDLEQDVRRPFDEVRNELRETGRSAEGTTSDLRRLGWVGPEPTGGPTHADAMRDLDEIEGGATTGGAPEGRRPDPPGADPTESTDATESTEPAPPARPEPPDHSDHTEPTPRPSPEKDA